MRHTHARKWLLDSKPKQTRYLTIQVHPFYSDRCVPAKTRVAFCIDRPATRRNLWSSGPSVCFGCLGLGLAHRVSKTWIPAALSHSWRTTPINERFKLGFGFPFPGYHDMALLAFGVLQPSYGGGGNNGGTQCDFLPDCVSAIMFPRLGLTRY